MSHLNFPTPAVLVVFTFENIIKITLVQPVFNLTMNFGVLVIFIAVMVPIVFLLSCFSFRVFGWHLSLTWLTTNRMMTERIQVGMGTGATKAERSTVMGLRVNVNIL
jgi:hypothetical protein